jgi:hypothetical protein
MEPLRARHARGTVLIEYVRMMRQRKDVDWLELLRVEDFALLSRLHRNAWYPMTSFERILAAVLSQSNPTDMNGQRLWGVRSAAGFVSENRALVAVGDPVETMMRLRVLRATLFDFPAFEVSEITEGHAILGVSYQMGPLMEEAACWQTIGLCEGVLTLAGARAAQSTVLASSWHGGPRTTVALHWL